MKNTLYPNAHKSVIPHSYAVSLENWLDEITTFYLYYKQLSPYIDQVAVPQKIRLISRHHPGQYTTGQLQRFLRKMRTVVKQLLQDMDVVDSDSMPITKQFCRKLIAHTRTLHQLNDEARKMNLLTGISEN